MNEIRVRSLGGMIPTGRNQNPQKKSLSPTATLSTKNPTHTSLGIIPGFYGERMAINCLNHSRTYEKDKNCAYTSKKTIWDPHQSLFCPIWKLQNQCKITYKKCRRQEQSSVLTFTPLVKKNLETRLKKYLSYLLTH
jgi:hypothetical protein